MAGSWKKLLYSDDTSGLGITRIPDLFDYFIGEAGNLTMTGTDNLGFGWYALLFNTTGIQNVAIGAGALRQNTTGDNNTAVGMTALMQNTIGESNVAIGMDALYKNTEGSFNVANGESALYNNTTGDYNIAIGKSALIANTLGIDNISIGDSALNHNTEGNYNLAFGILALSVNLTGSNNVAVGRVSLYTNSTGSGNVAIGAYSGEYELGSDAFYVNNQDRTNTAGDKTKSLLYGTFNATASLQTLTINGQLINNNVLISGGAITGITDLAVADGGTGASDNSTASMNLLLSSGKAFKHISFDSYDMVTAAVGGSGVNTQTLGLAKMDTSATANSYARQNFNSQSGVGLYSGDKLAWYLWIGPLVGNGVSFIGHIRDVVLTTQTDHTNTAKHAGLYFDNDVFYASTGNGVSQELTDVTALVFTGTKQNWLKITFDGTNVKFYWGDTLIATHTTYLATYGWQQAWVSNKANAVDLYLQAYSFFRMGFV